MTHSSSDATQQGGTPARDDRGPVWRTVVTDAEEERTTSELDHIGRIAEDMAGKAWRAVCNGHGRVDKFTRTAFNKARKAHEAPESTGTMVDALAAIVEKMAMRGLLAPFEIALRVDGVTYSLERAERSDDDVRTAVLAELASPADLEPGEEPYVTTWTLSDLTRDVDDIDHVTLTAQDNNHHSNVLWVKVDQYGIEVG